MPLLTNDIQAVLSSNGLVKMTSEIGAVEPGSNAMCNGHSNMDYQYKRISLSVDLASNSITLKRVANDAAVYNCVNVITTTNTACMGDVGLPGYVYTDNFSGCVFYLHKSGPNQVTGVHAHQGIDNTISKTISAGPMKGMVIDSDVIKEYSPKNYMLVKNNKELCRHETRSVLTFEEKNGGRNFLAFLSCVENNKATTFLYSYAGGMEGNRVGRLIETYVDNF
jgi:hypothetical protein